MTFLQYAWRTQDKSVFFDGRTKKISQYVHKISNQNMGEPKKKGKKKVIFYSKSLITQSNVKW